MSFTVPEQNSWSSLPQQQHMSSGQGTSGTAQVDGDPQAATVAAMQNASGQQAPSGNGQGLSGNGAQAQSQEQTGNEFLDGILAQIDPAHKSIVEPYIGKWNAGVTRRFQELHGELAPYKELGEPDTLAEAMQLYQMIDEDPQQVLQLLQEAVAETGGAQPTGQQPQGQLGQPPPGIEGEPFTLPPELEERFGTFEKVLEAVASQLLEQRSSEQEAQEDQELDQYFGLLKTEMGDFDEDFVIAKMMAGSTGEDAVKAYQQLIQGQVNQRSRQPDLPPILGGGGAVPQGGKSVVDASPKDTKALVAQILAASNQS